MAKKTTPKTSLLIVESPAKAKSIKKYLGRGYTVMASMGHLRDLPKSQLGIDTENGFDPKYITIRGKGELVSALKKAAKAAKTVLIATDPDREGEAIAWHIAALLGIDIASDCRVTFNEITKSAVTEAVRHPRAIDMALVDAQQARRILDRLLGYKLSPLLWAKVGSGLSAGRVQSVTTRMVVDREEEIAAFCPEEYWTVTARLKKGADSFEARYADTAGAKKALKSEEDAREVEALLSDSYTVDAVKYSEKKLNPRPPFTTSTMQQEAGKRLGFTAKRTMAAAQSLYEGVEVEGAGVLGLITYMRTDSLRTSDEAIAMVREYIGSTLGNDYLPDKARIYKARQGAQDAHEAIRPTTMMTPDAVKSSLKNDEYKLYKLIFERFVASQCAAAGFETVTADISSGTVHFKMSESCRTFPGYQTLWSEPEEEKAIRRLPRLAAGDTLIKEDVTSAGHFTEPPARYNEASLIKAMEEAGIGRPSTYAPTLSTILARRYVEREKKSLRPTELGRVITGLLADYFENVVDIDFTAGMENDLDKVGEGDLAWQKVVGDFYTPFEKDLSRATDELGKIEIKDEETDIPCEKCGRLMVIKNGRFGKFLACPAYPECDFTKAIVEETGVACPKCGSAIVGRTSRRGKKYYPCENRDCDFLLWDKPTGEVCPVCGSLMVEKTVRGTTVIRCSDRACKGKKEN